LFPTFNAPPWLMQIFVVILVIGFPATLVLEAVLRACSHRAYKAEPYIIIRRCLTLQSHGCFPILRLRQVRWGLR
jgi:hypothetical protein